MLDGTDVTMQYLETLCILMDVTLIAPTKETIRVLTTSWKNLLKSVSNKMASPKHLPSPQSLEITVGLSMHGIQGTNKVLD